MQHEEVWQLKLSLILNITKTKYIILHSLTPSFHLSFFTVLLY